MRRVYKYPVSLADRFSQPLPECAQVLHVEVQHGSPQMWVLVDPDARAVPRWFRLLGTGQAFEEEGLVHVGSFLQRDGALVFHLFEVKN